LLRASIQIGSTVRWFSELPSTSSCRTVRDRKKGGEKNMKRGERREWNKDEKIEGTRKNIRWMKMRRN
jgi:hypothetical protein